MAHLVWYCTVLYFATARPVLYFGTAVVLQYRPSQHRPHTKAQIFSRASRGFRKIWEKSFANDFDQHGTTVVMVALYREHGGFRSKINVSMHSSHPTEDVTFTTRFRRLQEVTVA